jgi:hypothetical protein
MALSAALADNGGRGRKGTRTMIKKPRAATIEDKFYALAEALVGAKEAALLLDTKTQGRKFGAGAIKTDGKIYAMLVRGKLVVKLPAEKVAALIADGKGANFDAGKGRPMMEWLVVDPSQEGEEWLALAKEARAYVSSVVAAA